MQLTTFGDLAAAYRNQLNNARLKMNMQRLGGELASGRTGDLAAATRGDLGNYAGIENGLRALEAYKMTTSEAALFTGSLQHSLGAVQDITAEVGPALLLAASTEEATAIQATVNDARARFSSVVSLLNTKVSDRALLAGTDVGNDALAGAETMLADLQTAIAAETTATGITAVVDAWFDDPGGGFETSGYLGATTDLAPFRIGQNEAAGTGLRADDQSIRDLLKGYALVALVADDALSGNHTERAELTTTAATRLLGADTQLANLRAGVGTVEQRIDEARARNSAETTALEIARSDILRIDPYRTATDLRTAETQLETLYTITARLSRLNLSEFLR